ncbi:LuxR C-terminal-related transcriptional regulator [Leucobacter sp. HY1908]
MLNPTPDAHYADHDGAPDADPSAAAYPGGPALTRAVVVGSLKRLVQPMSDAVAQHALLLVCAPEGYDKRALVHAWLSGAAARPAAWLRVTPCNRGDLWSLIARELAGTGADPAPDLAAHARGDASSGSPDAAALAAAQAAASRLAAALTEPVTLVIEGYHHVTGADTDLALAQLHQQAPQLTLIVIAHRVQLLDGPFMASRARIVTLGPGQLALPLPQIRETANAFGVSQRVLSEQLLAYTRGWPAAVRTVIAGDPRSALQQFALENLEVLSDSAQRIVLATALVESLSVPLAAEFNGSDLEIAQQAMRELLEQGLIEACTAERTEFRCHPAVADALRARAERTYAVSEQRALLRGRADMYADTAPVTAFFSYCAAGDFGAAERLLVTQFTKITDEGEKTARLVRKLPDSVLLAHPAFATARLFFDSGDPSVPFSSIEHTTALFVRSLSQPEQSPVPGTAMYLPLVAQHMGAARLQQNYARADEYARVLEAQLTPVLSIAHEQAGVALADAAAAAFEHPSPRDLNDAALGVLVTDEPHGALLIVCRELALTVIAAGHTSRARSAWLALHSYACALEEQEWRGFASGSIRTVTDPESGLKWQQAALSGLAFTELLDGNMLECARYLERADAIAFQGITAPGSTWVLGEIARAHLSVELQRPDQLTAAQARLEPLQDRVEPWPALLIAEAEATRLQRGVDWASAQLEANITHARLSMNGAASWDGWLAAYRVQLNTVAGQLAHAKSLLAQLDNTCVSSQLGHARFALFSGDNMRVLLIAQGISNAGSTVRERLVRCLMITCAAWAVGRHAEAAASAASAAGIFASAGLSSPLWSVPHDMLSDALEGVIAAGEARENDDLERLLEAVAAVPPAARAIRYERLTEMELRTLTETAVHASINQTAEAMFVTPATVKKHLNSVYRKLHAKGRDEAILRAKKMGLLPVDD